MTEKVFVDSNILVYAYDAGSGEKQKIAAETLRPLWAAGGGVLSMQVLHEFYATVTRKLRAHMHRDLARKLVREYSSWEIQPLNPTDIISASELEERYQLDYWDALILLAAAKAGATKLLSEDLNAGQTILGVTIENPFAR